MTAAEHDELREERQSLWWLTVSPAVWAAHFLASYTTAAVWCAKVAGPDGSLFGARVANADYTVLALAGIAITGRHGYRRHTFGGTALPHDFDTPADRHRFLGFATVLLSGLSAVATAFAALAAVFFDDCR
jgi:hypothetical protein